jgi:SAM-dependent methyltransferase
MGAQLRLSPGTERLLRCPACQGTLRRSASSLRCENAECGARYPIVDGVPVLIDEARSVFALDDFVLGRSTYFNLQRGQYRLSPGGIGERVKGALKRRVPDLERNLKARANYARFAELLLARSATPLILVLGGSILGAGMESLLARPQIEIVETDVSFGPRTGLICDAHAIPFDAGAFDGVVVQAVLEHVVDPARCVEEIRRVLGAGGLVYAETPFMQQVHGGRYDFTRFTHLGHRRLFRHFEEIASGAVGGPGMALAWSVQYFMWSFTTSRSLRRLIELIARLALFPLPYIDHLLIDRRGALDAAAGIYFLGRKAERVLSDRELLAQYRGAV